MAHDPAFEARCLLRAARGATLATVNPDGHPFASLVTPACMQDGTLILLISRLAEHTKHLVAYQYCSVLVSGTPTSTNPQTTSRVTVTGAAGLVDALDLKARYLAIHPYATLYAEFSDFTTWQITPTSALLVAGFAQAHRLDATSLMPDPQAVAAISTAEVNIIGHCNKDHPDALAAIAGQPGAWRMVSVDVDGFDLAQDDRTIRVHWSAPVQTSTDVRRELVRMTEAARRGGGA